MTILSTFAGFPWNAVFGVIATLCMIACVFICACLETNNKTGQTACTVVLLITLFLGFAISTIATFAYPDNFVYTEALIDYTIIPPEFNNYTFIEKRGDIWVLRSRIDTQ